MVFMLVCNHFQLYLGLKTKQFWNVIGDGDGFVVGLTLARKENSDKDITKASYCDLIHSFSSKGNYGGERRVVSALKWELAWAKVGHPLRESANGLRSSLV